MPAALPLSARALPQELRPGNVMHGPRAVLGSCAPSLELLTLLDEGAPSARAIIARRGKCRLLRFSLTLEVRGH